MRSFRIHQRSVLFVLLMGALLFFGNACTMTVHTFVQDESGKPVENAVVFATSPQTMVPAPPPATGGTGMEKRHSIDLMGQNIVPVVLPVQVGATVSFLNRDALQHHIYSISPAKPFELTIDKGTSSADLMFDKPGTVVMGSAINDRMIGYIYVLKTPWFARTGDDGKADLRYLPRGAYDVRVWHPAMKGSAEATVKRVVPSAQRDASVKFTVSLQSAQDAESKPGPASQPAAGGKE